MILFIFPSFSYYKGLELNGKKELKKNTKERIWSDLLKVLIKAHLGGEIKKYITLCFQEF